MSKLPSVSILLIVNASPWGSTLANTAWRFARAALDEGQEVAAVFFHGDGVYNAIPGRATDAGTHDLAAAWAALNEEFGVDLMLCSGSSGRRLSRADVDSLSPGFREAGLVEMHEMAAAGHRVVGF